MRGGGGGVVKHAVLPKKNGHQTRIAHRATEQHINICVYKRERFNHKRTKKCNTSTPRRRVRHAAPNSNDQSNQIQSNLTRAGSFHTSVLKRSVGYTPHQRSYITFLYKHLRTTRTSCPSGYSSSFSRPARPSRFVTPIRHDTRRRDKSHEAAATTPVLSRGAKRSIRHLRWRGTF